MLLVGREFLWTEVGVVGTPPDNVIVDTRGAYADIIAYGIGIGGGIPGETDAIEGGVDSTDTQGTGCRGDIIDIENPHGVGAEDALRSSGLYTIAHRVGTDGTMDGVEVMGVGKGGYQRETFLPREMSIERIAAGLGTMGPIEVAHIMTHRNIPDEPHRSLSLGMGAKQQQAKEDGEEPPTVEQ